MTPYGPVGPRMVLYGHIWSHFVPICPVCFSMVLFGLVWSCMVPYGRVWPRMASYGTLSFLRLHMFAFVQLTQLLHKFCACYIRDFGKILLVGEEVLPTSSLRKRGNLFCGKVPPNNMLLCGTLHQIVHYLFENLTQEKNISYSMKTS